MVHSQENQRDLVRESEGLSTRGPKTRLRVPFAGQKTNQKSLSLLGFPCLTEKTAIKCLLHGDTTARKSDNRLNTHLERKSLCNY